MIKPAKILYFFKDKVIPEDLKFRFQKQTKNPQSKGPGGSSGMLIAPFEDCLPEYRPNNQTWSVMNKINIGIANDAKPQDFEKDFVYPGYKVKLGDGNYWVIPIALLGAPNFSFPQYETMDENGNWIWKVQDEFGFICEMAKLLYNSTDKDGDFKLDETKMRRSCCAIIGVNYNLTEMECAALKLLTTEAYQAIIEALLDIPGLRELTDGLDFEPKKKA